MTTYDALALYWNLQGDYLLYNSLKEFMDEYYDVFRN